MLRILVFIAALTLVGCNYQNPNRVLIIQPFRDMPSQQVHTLAKSLAPYFKTIVLKSPIDLPGAAFYPARNRYKADVLIKYLKQFGTKDTVVLGITGKDISTTKGNRKDWGVMGLGYQPGRSCITSTFRLNKSRILPQLFKTSIHELGHTEGLPHCINHQCYMRDAEGGNPLDEEKGFCSTCKKYLQSRGWLSL